MKSYCKKISKDVLHDIKRNIYCEFDSCYFTVATIMYDINTIDE